MLGSGAGHVADMISRLKSNKELRKGKKFFQSGQACFEPSPKKELSSKQASKEQLFRIRQESGIRKRRENTISIVALAISALIVALAIWKLIAVINDKIT